MKYQLNTIKRKYQPGMLKKLEPLLLNLMWLAQDYAKTLIFICTILVLQGKCIIFLAQQEAQKKNPTTKMIRQKCQQLSYVQVSGLKVH